MWTNALPGNCLQVSLPGTTQILTEQEQRELGAVLAKRGMVRAEDCYDPWLDNVAEKSHR